MKTDFTPYLNIPFKHRGRDFTGCDCWGLIRLIYERKQGIFLPEGLDVEYENDLNIRDRAYLQDGLDNYIKREGFEKVTHPLKKWDCLIFYASPRRVVADHVGLCIGDGKFIHTSNRLDMSLVSRFEGFWESKFYGGARYIGTS